MFKPGPENQGVAIDFTDPTISLRIGTSYPWEIKDRMNLNVSGFIDFRNNLHKITNDPYYYYIPSNFITFGVKLGAECFL